MATAAKRSSKRRRAIQPGPVAQQKILEAVDDLFYREGARAVGVDAVARHAGISKMALYRQFESKDALMMQYLARMDEVFWGHFEASVGKHPGQPKRQLLQFFIDLTARSNGAGFRGCPFVNVAVEFPDPEHPARQFVADTKARLLARLTALARAARARHAGKLAASLAFLIEGAYTVSQTFAPPGHLMAQLPGVAEALISGAISDRRTTRARA